MTMQKIEAVSHRYKTRDGANRLARRGDVVDTSQWQQRDVDRAMRCGVFVSSGEMADAVSEVDTGEASVAELAALITGEKLNVAKTVALAGGDPDLAMKVIEAEKLATEGASRMGVFKTLVAVVDRAAE